MNFLGLNPMKALVWSGVVPGFSTPPLILLILLITNNRAVMGDKINGIGINVLGWVTAVAVFAATIGLVLMPRHSFIKTAGQRAFALGDVWGNDALAVPYPGQYRNLFTDAVHDISGEIRLADIFADFPVALLFLESPG